MPQTLNEEFRDALVRHQIGLLRLSGSVRNRVIALLDASEDDIQLRIERVLSRIATGQPVDLRQGTTAQRRLAALERSIAETRGAAHARALNAWVEELQALARAEPAFTVAALAQASPVVLDLVIPAASRLRSLVRTDPFQGRVLREWAADLERADLARISDQIRIGLVQGDALRDITRRVVGSSALSGADGVTEITRRGAAAITRTAVNHFSNAARAQLYAENSDLFSKEVFVATLDSRTTSICASNDGKLYDVGEGPMPPLHFNCRSLRAAAVDGQVVGTRPMKQSTERELLGEFASREGIARVSSRGALPHGTRGAFDAFARGRIRELTGTVPATTTYSQFLRRQTVAFQDEVLGTTKARLFRSGGLELDRFVNRRGDELTLAQLARLEADAFHAAGLDPRDYI